MAHRHRLVETGRIDPRGGLVRKRLVPSLAALLPLCLAVPLHGQITVSKSPTTPVISAGDPVGYLILVTNLNPTTAASGTITDTLPAGPTWTQPSGCTFTPATRLLSCPFGAAKNGGAAFVSVTGTSAPGGCSNLLNTASATSNVGSNSSGLATIVVLCPDLHLLKVSDATFARSGEPVGFTYAVRNEGLGVARSVTLTDPLPADTWSILPPVSGCQIDLSGHLACAFGDVGAHLGRSVHVSGPTTTSMFGSFGSQATAHATNGPGDVTSSASVDEGGRRGR
jgi:uncharacterized repeat protein (TIGR01451 family)